MSRYLVALVLGALFVSPAVAGTGLSNPDSTAIYLLQCKFAHIVPPYAAMAGTEPNVQSADEFHKDDELKKEEAVLAAKFARLQTVDTITVNLRSTFGNYDSQYGEFDLDLTDGTYIPYSAFGRDLRLALTNGSTAQSWKLSPQQAEAVLGRNNGGRTVTLVLHIALQDSTPAADSDPMVLNAKIVSYEVLGPYNNLKLGAMTVAAQ